MAHEIATALNGKVVEIDTTTGKCRRVMHDFAELDESVLDTVSMNLKIYQSYLRDRFIGEDVPLKKGKLYFRGYRITCDAESGFQITDTNNGYAEVDTPFEGIPSPRELGDMFDGKSIIRHTADELAEAAERGCKKLAEERERIDEVVEGEPDYELLRRKVLAKISAIRTGKSEKIDPALVPDMIPFKKWRMAVNKVLKQWKERRIRYAKFLAAVEQITEEQVFEDVTEPKRCSFVGTLLPDFKKVGELVGNQIMVDGKLIGAVSFLQDYLLHYEPKVMPRLMQYANGDIDAVTLLKDPYTKDTVEFNPKLLARTAESAQVLTALFASVGLEAPQDVYYDDTLKVGDKILLWYNERWSKKTILRVEDNGIFFSTEFQLLKADKFIKLPAEETEGDTTNEE